MASGVIRESLVCSARSKNHGMYGTSKRENREIPRPAPPGDRRWGRSGNARGGKPGMNERGKSDGPVVPANPPNKAGAAGGGGGKGTGQGKHGR